MKTQAKAVRPASGKTPKKVAKRKGRETSTSRSVLVSSRYAKSTPRRQQRVEARSAAILDAALTLFSRFGLHGTTVDQIAAAADISKTNLFYYFASKEEVYVAVLRRLLDEWLAPLRALEVDSDPIEAIRDYIRRKVEFSRTQPEASRLFCLEIVQGAPLIGPALRTSLKALVDAKAGVIEAWIAAGRLAPVNPYHLIFAVWSTTQHYADFASQVEAVVGRGLADDDYLEQVISDIQRIILDGIKPDRPLLRRAKNFT